MNRHACPHCGNSLRLRPLAHVPDGDGVLTFRCSFCGTLLRRNPQSVPLIAFLWGSRARSLTTFLLGVVIFSTIRALLGIPAFLTALAIFGGLLLAAALLSRRPAYSFAE